MTPPRQIACAAALFLFSTSLAAATPARVETDLNIRSGEGTGFPVIDVMPAGAVVDVTGCGDGWCFVSEYGGFASASYLDSVASGPSAYVVPPAAVIVPAPVYREPNYWDGRRIIRRGIREFRRDVRRDARRDWRQERREDRREARQERRQDRHDVRQQRRENRREARRDDRGEPRQGRDRHRNN